jgi:ABC-type Fe3+-siderophore transport system permease subunit
LSLSSAAITLAADVTTTESQTYGGAVLLAGAAVAIASNIAFASALVPGPANAFS